MTVVIPHTHTTHTHTHCSDLVVSTCHKSSTVGDRLEYDKDGHIKARCPLAREVRTVQALHLCSGVCVCVCVCVCICVCVCVCVCVCADRER